jgi:hypothetical protein
VNHWRGELDPQHPVFVSRNKAPDGAPRAISRVPAWEVLKAAFDANEFGGKLATHTMRKTFAASVYQRLNHDLVELQQRATTHMKETGS